MFLHLTAVIGKTKNARIILWCEESCPLMKVFANEVLYKNLSRKHPVKKCLLIKSVRFLEYLLIWVNTVIILQINKH